MEQAEAESGNMSVFSFLHGEYSGACFSISGLPNINRSTRLGLSMSLIAEREGVMDSLMFGPSYMATMSFTL